MTAVPVGVTGLDIPLALVARPAGGQVRMRCSIVLAGGTWMADAAGRARLQLEAQTCITRSSGVLVVAYAPTDVPEVLAQLTDVDPLELAGARIAAQADAQDGRPTLWAFIASCQVLWPQAADHRGLS